MRIFKTEYPFIDDLFKYLQSEGYSGTLNDMMFQYLGDQGYTGAITDRVSNANKDELSPSGFDVSVSGLALNDTYGAGPQIGQQLSFVVSNETDGALVDPTYSWFTDDTGEQGTSATYTPDQNDDLQFLRLRISSSNYNPKTVSIGRVRQVPPEFTSPATVTGSEGVPFPVGSDISAVPGNYSGAGITSNIVVLERSDDGDTADETVASSSEGLTATAVAEDLDLGDFFRATHTITNSGGTAVSQSGWAGPQCAQPDAFTSGLWSASGGVGQITVTINSLPDNNFAAITNIQYNIGAGWVNTNDTVSFTITSVVAGSVDVQIRAVNAAGPGQASDVKSVTVTAPAFETISLLEVTGPQNEGGGLPVNYTISGADSTVAWGIYSGFTPDATELRAGTNMVDFGTVSLATSGSVSIPLADEINETSLNLAMVTTGSSTVVVATGSVPFAINTVTAFAITGGTESFTITAEPPLNTPTINGGTEAFTIASE